MNNPPPIVSPTNTLRTNKMINRQALTLSISLFVMLFLALPISLIPALIVFLYIRWFKGGDFTSVINRLERINGTKLLIACGLTFASIAIYQSANYITHIGFPASFITYYNFPFQRFMRVILT